MTSGIEGRPPPGGPSAGNAGPRTHRGDRRGQHVRRGRTHPGRGRHPRPSGPGRHHAQHLRHIRHGTHLPGGTTGGHKGIVASLGADAPHHTRGRVSSIHYKKHAIFVSHAPGSEGLTYKFAHGSLRDKEKHIAQGLGKTLIPHGHMTPITAIDFTIYRTVGILVYNTDTRLDHPKAHTHRGPRVGHVHHPAGGHHHTHMTHPPIQLTEDLHFFGVNSPGPHYTPPPAPHLPPVISPHF